MPALPPPGQRGGARAGAFGCACDCPSELCRAVFCSGGWRRALAVRPLPHEAVYGCRGAAWTKERRRANGKGVGAVTRAAHSSGVHLPYILRASTVHLPCISLTRLVWERHTLPFRWTPRPKRNWRAATARQSRHKYEACTRSSRAAWAASIGLRLDSRSSFPVFSYGVFVIVQQWVWLPCSVCHPSVTVCLCGTVYVNVCPGPCDPGHDLHPRVCGPRGGYRRRR